MSFSAVLIALGYLSLAIRVKLISTVEKQQAFQFHQQESFVMGNNFKNYLRRVGLIWGNEAG